MRVSSNQGNTSKNPLKIAIIGATGLLGSNLARLYGSNDFDLRCFSRRDHYLQDGKIQSHVLDFNDLENSLNHAFNKWIPDIVINCIGIASIEMCDSENDLAMMVNAIYPEAIAKFCSNYGIYFIHISTDHFFHDDKELHTETDTTINLNFYSKTKLLGEELVFRANSKALIVRTNFIGFHEKSNNNFLHWLVRSSLNKKQIILYSNYYTSPITIDFLSNILVRCFYKNLHGIYNISSSSRISKSELGFLILNSLNLDTSKIVCNDLENNDQKVKRAISLALSVKKIEKDLIFKMPKIEEIINDIVSQYNPNRENW